MLEDRSSLFSVENPLLVFTNVHRAVQYANSCLPRWNGLSEEFLTTVHRLALDGLIPEDGLGCYRERNVGIARSIFTPPHYERVPELMNSLINDINTESKSCGEGPCYVSLAIHLMAKTYYSAYRIQPFENGNKRVLRIVIDAMARVHGLKPPIMDQLANRLLFERYEEVNRKANLAPFELFLVEQILIRYKSHGAVLDGVEVSELEKLRQMLMEKSQESYKEGAFAKIWTMFTHPCFD